MKVSKTRKPAAKNVTRVAAVKKGTLGTYTVPRGDVSVAIPPFWTFCQTNEDLHLNSPSGETSVIVNAYSRNPEIASFDARHYLQHLLSEIPNDSRVKRDPSTKSLAAARYRDAEGNSWYVQFRTKGNTLLLAELSTSEPLTSRDAKTGIAVLKSLTLKGR